jgi:hypothetical protein
MTAQVCLAEVHLFQVYFSHKTSCSFYIQQDRKLFLLRDLISFVVAVTRSWPQLRSQVKVTSSLVTLTTQNAFFIDLFTI